MTSAEPVDLVTSRVGQGPPVLVLHGLLGRGRNWATVAQRLAERFELRLLDLRNHGGSPRAAAMSYPAMAADLARLVEREGLAPVRLVGHSMGGKAVMTLALTRPELVERLAVVDVAPVDYGAGQGFAGYIRAMLAVDLEHVQRRAQVEAALAPAVPDPGIRAFLAANLETRDGRLRWLPNLPVLLESLPSITGFPAELQGRRYDGPTLFLRGGRSDYVLPEHEPLIRRLFPAVRIETVERAGHWVHAEAPAETVAALAAFLAPAAPG